MLFPPPPTIENLVKKYEKNKDSIQYIVEAFEEIETNLAKLES
jgi:hypothetical protein